MTTTVTAMAIAARVNETNSVTKTATNTGVLCCLTADASTFLSSSDVLDLVGAQNLGHHLCPFCCKRMSQS